MVSMLAPCTQPGEAMSEIVNFSRLSTSHYVSRYEVVYLGLVENFGGQRSARYITGGADGESQSNRGTSMRIVPTLGR